MMVRTGPALVFRYKVVAPPRRLRLLCARSRRRAAAPAAACGVSGSCRRPRASGGRSRERRTCVPDTTRVRLARMPPENHTQAR